MAGDSAPPAPTDRDAITDWSVFVAQVEPLVDRAHDVAHGIVGDADVAADIVRGVFDSVRAEPTEALTGGGSGLESILLATRAAALRHTSSPGAPSTGAPSTGVPRMPTASRNRVRLTQAAAVVLGADDTSTLELHLRHGIGAAALAGVLGVSAADASRRLTQLRSRLDDALAAFTLWRGGDPACPELANALADGTTLDPTPFDIVAFDAVVAHRATCAACSRLHEALTNPAGMLVAAPVVAVPPALRRLMLPTPATAAGSSGAHRRSTDDTPTALLWAPVERPARTAPPDAEAHRSGRWSVIAASAAALLLVVAGGVTIAVRGSSGNDRPATTAAATPTDDLTEATEVRSLGPPPPVVPTTGGTTSTNPPDTTGPESTEPSNPATENTEPGNTEPGNAETQSVTATTARPPTPPRPAPRVAVTTAPPGPTTTRPDVDTGIPPLPPPPTTTLPTTAPTTAPTTTPTTTPTSPTATTVAEPEPTTPEPAAPAPEPTTSEPVPGP